MDKLLPEDIERGLHLAKEFKRIEREASFAKSNRIELRYAKELGFIFGKLVTHQRTQPPVQQLVDAIAFIDERIETIYQPHVRDGFESNPGGVIATLQEIKRLITAANAKPSEDL